LSNGVVDFGLGELEVFHEAQTAEEVAFGLFVDDWNELGKRESSREFFLEFFKL
jgi:hypothetical protein